MRKIASNCKLHIYSLGAVEAKPNAYFLHLHGIRILLMLADSAHLLTLQPCNHRGIDIHAQDIMSGIHQAVSGWVSFTPSREVTLGQVAATSSRPSLSFRL